MFVSHLKARVTVDLIYGTFVMNHISNNHNVLKFCDKDTPFNPGYNILSISFVD